MAAKKNRAKKLSKYSQQSVAETYLYTRGLQYSLNGVEYIGEYHIIGPDAFTGPTPIKTDDNININNSISVLNPRQNITSLKTQDQGLKLTSYYSSLNNYSYDNIIKSKLISNFRSPKQIMYQPKDSAYDAGIDSRYFVQKRGADDNFAIEIDINQWELIGSYRGIDNGLYYAAAIKWMLVGTYDYVYNYNQQELIKAEPLVPNIMYAIKNFTEYSKLIAF